MQFELIVRKEGKTISIIVGRKMRDEDISTADLEKVIWVEQYLERMLGYRFYINSA